MRVKMLYNNLSYLSTFPVKNIFLILYRDKNNI
jgi:hypothetical protein